MSKKTKLVHAKGNEENESHVVSCSILNVSRGRGRILTDIATSINVQLMFEGSQIPFVPFKGYENFEGHNRTRNSTSNEKRYLSHYN